MATKKQVPACKKEQARLSSSEEDEVLEKIKDARIYCARVALPWMSDAIMAMNLSQSYDCPTMGVDRWWRCVYNPITVKKWEMKNIAAVLAHEASHLLRNHWKRALPEPTMWNIAGDFEINDGLLIGTKLEFPQWEEEVEVDGKKKKHKTQCMFPKDFGFQDNLAAEEYYDLLLESNHTKVIEPDEQFGGSCSDGNPREWEDDKDGEGKDRENDKIGEEDAKWIINKVAQNVKQWDPKWGDRPGGLERWAEAILNPAVDWRTQLRNTISRSVEFVRGQMFTSFKRISRRRHPQFLLPGKVSPNPRIKIIVDTSGSMSDDLLGQCLGEIQGVLRSVPHGNIDVISGDTNSANKQTIRNITEVKLMGGGGTDMGAIVKENCENVDVIIVLTDGYTPWCEQVKPRVIACIFSDEKAPDWIDVIRVRPDC